jgi:hypothetical protein
LPSGDPALDNAFNINGDLGAGSAGGTVNIHREGWPVATLIVIESGGLLGEGVKVLTASVGVEWEHGGEAYEHVLVRQMIVGRRGEQSSENVYGTVPVWLVCSVGTIRQTQEIFH